MIEEIKRRLDAGEVVELECVDLNEFLTEEFNSKTKYNMRCMRDFNSLVVDVNEAGITMADGFFIDEDETKHFRIKRNKPTFDDLIDVAVKAYKNRLLDIFLMNDEVITVFNYDATGTKEGINRADTSKYYQFVEFIKSLYTETFVIEGGSCILKINENIQALVLANGCDIVDRVYFEGGSMRLRDCFGNSISLTNLNILKGATVTQKRGK